LARARRALSDAIVCALRARGIAVDYLLAEAEGHSFGNEETSLAVNRAIEQFLAQQLGGRVSPSSSERTEAALASLRSAGRSVSCQEQAASDTG
jgi:hypothetical protein